VLEGLHWAWPHGLRTVAADCGAGATVAVVGPVARTWHFVATPDGWRDRPVPGDPVVGRLHMSTEEAWRLLSNNLDPAAQQALDASGDRRVVEALRRSRAVIGRPR
jgi:hypothetical protein